MARYLRQIGDSAMWALDVLGGGLSEIVRRLLGRNPTVPTPDYRVYTKRFDREVGAEELLAQHTGGLGRAGSSIGCVDHLVIESFCSRWETGHDLGARPLFTFLLDMSGSMRGEKSAKVMETVLSLGSILERIGPAFEVLGFTTSTWRGGKARGDWVDRWKPAEPGRLCDLLHIIFKTANEQTGQWRKRVSLLLAEDLLKENVDGEALLWAQKRATEHNPSKWLCMLISDGAPVDDSTILANGGEQDNWYLQQHLNTVVDAISGAADVRLGQLGLDREANERFRFRRSVGELDDCILQAISLLEEMIWLKTPECNKQEPV